MHSGKSTIMVQPCRLYNMLQDLRHLVVLDLRSEQEFNKS